MGLPQRRFSSAVTATLLAVLIAAGPAAARLPPASLPRTVLSQTRPDLVVLVVPLTPAAQEAAARIDYAFRQSVEASGRFDLARLPDLLDAENARVREGRVEEAEASLAIAREAYDGLDTIKALAEADKALKAYQDADLTRRMKGFTGAWIMKIASLVANGENKAAQLEMERLIAVDPEVQFSPNFFPPEEIAFAEKTRKALENARQTLEVKTNPSGAEVFVNGRFQGISPVTVSGLAASDHFVTVKAPGYSLAQQKTRPGTVEITLRKSEAWPRYQALLERVTKDPEGPLRDAAAKEFGSWAGVDQVVLAIVDMPTGARQARVIALRLEPKDGHNYAYAEEQLPVGDELQAKAEALAAKILGRDVPKRGDPVTHFRDAGGGGWKKTAGYVLLGTGVAVLAGGVFFGLQANGQSQRFRATPQTDVRSQSIARTGRTYALMADLSFLVGLAASGAGGYLAFASGGAGSSPSPRKDARARDEKRAEPSRAADEKKKAPPADEARRSEDEDRGKKKDAEKKKKSDEDEDDLRNY